MFDFVNDGKKLKEHRYTSVNRYYFWVALPFIFVLIGFGIFWKALLGTFEGNPHPQINYAIIFTIVFSTAIMLWVIYTYVREEKLLKSFMNSYQSNDFAETIFNIATGEVRNITILLQLVGGTVGRAITRQEQSAIEHELNTFEHRLMAQQELPQYVSGLLVALGLLGTFIGLLVTLADTSNLIGSLVEMAPANTATQATGGSASDDMFRNMISSLKKPMISMGIAFSASMLGLLGSIAVGFSMVALRSASHRLIAIVNSEVHRVIELESSNWDANTKKGSVVGGDSLGFDGMALGGGAIGYDENGNLTQSGGSLDMTGFASETPPATGTGQAVAGNFDGMTDMLRQLVNAVNQSSVRMEMSAAQTTKILEVLQKRNDLDAMFSKLVQSGTTTQDFARQQLETLQSMKMASTQMGGFIESKVEPALNTFESRLLEIGQANRNAFTMMGEIRQAIGSLANDGQIGRNISLNLLETLTDLANSMKMNASMGGQDTTAEKLAALTMLIQQTHESSMAMQRDMSRQLIEAITAQQKTTNNLLQDLVMRGSPTL